MAHGPRRRWPIQRFWQVLADGRGKLGPDLHLVAFTVRQAIDTDLARVRRYGLRILAVNLDELGPIAAAGRQALGKLHAQARLAGIRIDLVLKNAKAVLGQEFLVALANIRVVDECQAGTEGVERGTKEGAALERVGKHRQGRGLGRRLRGARIGIEERHRRH